MVTKCKARVPTLAFKIQSSFLFCQVFPKGICLKVNMIALVEFKLAYFEATVHYFSHYATRSDLQYGDIKKNDALKKVMSDLNDEHLIFLSNLGKKSK